MLKVKAATSYLALDCMLQHLKWRSLSVRLPSSTGFVWHSLHLLHYFLTSSWSNRCTDPWTPCYMSMAAPYAMAAIMKDTVLVAILSGPELSAPASKMSSTANPTSSGWSSAACWWDRSSISCEEDLGMFIIEHADSIFFSNIDCVVSRCSRCSASDLIFGRLFAFVSIFQKCETGTGNKTRSSSASNSNFLWFLI
jgi:hypothetical protein